MIVWRGAANTGLVSSADRAYMNAPVPCPMPNLWTHSPEKIEMDGTVNDSAFMRRSSCCLLTWLALLFYDEAKDQ